MKKILAAVSSLGMALSMSVAVPMPAQAASNSGSTEFCKSIIVYFPGHTLGDCISSFQSNANAAATKYCNFIRDEGLLELFGFANFGDCVRTLKGL